jgi:hypothetical protein
VTEIHAETKCINTTGEATVTNGDIPSAKAEAISRAKLSALEEAVGIDIKSQTVVQNMMYVDEMVSKQLNGSILSSKLLWEKRTDDVITVHVISCVEKDVATNAFDELARNDSIAVFIPAKNSGRISGLSEQNILSETLIDNLTNQGYKVIDLSFTLNKNQQVLSEALNQGNIANIHPLMTRSLANVLLVGSVEFTVSSRKGTNIGYGIAMPFNRVTARLTYRLLANKATGKIVVLTAGTEEGQGVASSIDDATAISLKNLSKKLIPVILDKIDQNVKSESKKIRLTVSGITELSDNFAIKEIFQNTAWVSEVNVVGMGEFDVKYTENPIYLANSLQQKGKFKLLKYSRQSLLLNYIR